MQYDELSLAMRRDGELYRLVLPDIPSSPFKVIAGIGRRGGAKVGIDDRRYQHDFQVGFAENPSEGLCIGRDIATPVGEYDSEFPFQGTLGFVKIFCKTQSAR